MTAPWPSGPAHPSLEPDALHVWRLPLDVGSDRAAALTTNLDAGERQRAARLILPPVRARFQVAHGSLREVLARYTGGRPEDLAFDIGPHGKPSLSAGAGLEFNLSHSRGWALLALCQERELGVDIEEVRENVATAKLAKRYFAATEQAALQALPESQHREAFFATWTRKEAFLKARGSGMALPLGAFSVTVDPGGPARLETTRDDSDEAARWSMHDLDPISGFRGAVCVAAGAAVTLQRWSL